jgi:hypothetical protein
MSGFEMTCDLTPRWWDKYSHRERMQILPAVLAKVMGFAPWVFGIGYEMRADRVVAHLVLPADVELKTIMAKRQAALDELDKLKP